MVAANATDDVSLRVRISVCLLHTLPMTVGVASVVRCCGSTLNIVVGRIELILCIVKKLASCWQFIDLLLFHCMLLSSHGPSHN